MYNPSAFRETDPQTLAAAIDSYPLATLVTVGRDGTLDASHIPLLYIASVGTSGVLQGHMAKANGQWQDYQDRSPCLAIFLGPEHYISPTWYPSKQLHGKVVPTWNYVAIHVHGTLTVHDDPDWLIANVAALTDQQERFHEQPWKVSDAPDDYIENMLKAIVGIELKISHWQGKWKMSQNRPQEDRAGVADALERTPAQTIPAQVASLVRASLVK